MSKFYITSSIPYVNAPGHIGHALEFIQTDVIARAKRQQKNDVWFVTGTDEHGVKIARAAATANISPRKFVDSISGKFLELLTQLNVSNDDFIRTTDQERHWPSVKKVWEKLFENGDLEKRLYKGFYCVGCEAFITEKELAEGKCELHKKEPEQIQEENWFFKLSKYAPQIREKIEKDELYIIPVGRKMEMLSLIEQGLQDVSFSRPKEKLQWGIPVPGDDTQVIYVWADALVNYISALGYPEDKRFKKYWPADIHVVGKDILRFHATIWPAILLSLGVELPKTIFVHGFITVKNEKMSKSLGNVIDPSELVRKYGVDALRYFFLREIPPTEDGDFSYEKFEARYSADLAGGLGNLVSRVTALAEGISIPRNFNDVAFQNLIKEMRSEMQQALDKFQFSAALVKIWAVIHFCDKYIEENRPWEDSGEKEEVIGDLLLALSNIGELLKPFLPETSEKIARQLKQGRRESLFPKL